MDHLPILTRTARAFGLGYRRAARTARPTEAVLSDPGTDRAKLRDGRSASRPGSSNAGHRDRRPLAPIERPTASTKRGPSAPERAVPMRAGAWYRVAARVLLAVFLLCDARAVMADTDSFTPRPHAFASPDAAPGMEAVGDHAGALADLENDHFVGEGRRRAMAAGLQTLG